jgi:predicted  nucleic acid-binding Zn-ribbon protein
MKDQTKNEPQKQAASKNKPKMNWWLLALGGIVIIAIGILMKVQDEDKKKLIDQSIGLEMALTERDSAYNEVIDVMYAVEEQIERIKQREKLVSSLSEDGFTENRKDGMVRDMRAIDSLIINTNRQVANLLSRLDNANMNLTSFKSRLQHLSKELEERKKSFEELRAELQKKDMELAKITFSVQNLEDKVLAHEQTIEEQLQEIFSIEQEMNKAFFAIDSKKKLVENGVVIKEGGFLGLGRTLELKEDVDQKQFGKLDIRMTSRLMIDAKEIELITEHPSDSYQLVKDGDKIQYLAITDPANFWRISKYLVVAAEG